MYGPVEVNKSGQQVWGARSTRTRPAVATRGEGAVERRDEVGTRLNDGRLIRCFSVGAGGPFTLSR